jgi:hypothetical protein
LRQFKHQGKIMTVKINAILVIAATIAAVGSLSAATIINPRYANMAALTLKQEATRLFAENEALKAGGGGAGPAAAESAALAQCITSGDNTAYINLAKETVKAKLAVILGADEDVLKGQLNTFIDGLANATVVLTPPSAPDANPAHATDAHLQSARKAAIEMAMVKKVNEEMDSLGTAPRVAQPIKNALMAVFAGH